MQADLQGPIPSLAVILRILQFANQEISLLIFGAMEFSISLQGSLFVYLRTKSDSHLVSTVVLVLECPSVLVERMMQDRLSFWKPLDLVMQADLQGPVASQDVHSGFDKAANGVSLVGLISY